MRAVITGAAGQDGQYLSRFLRDEGVEVIGISRSGSFYKTRLNDFEEISALISSTRPDYVFHLAAESTTRHEVWLENHETITTGTLFLLEAVRQFSPQSKVFIAGSGLQFRNNGEPIKESDPFEESSMYAVSRIQSVHAARYYRKLGIKSYVGYLFNHDSPLRTERHINRKIAETVKRIASGSREMLEIGDMTVRKEFGFAGDIVRAMWTLVTQDTVYEAVLGTGKAYPILDWIACCFALRDLDWRKYVIQNEGFNPEYDILVSDPKTIMNLGWSPEYDIEALAGMMME